MVDHVVVIGAGIVGVSTAVALAREGLKVTVIEGGQPGNGATRAAFGSLTPYSDSSCLPHTRDFARRSVALYPSWVKGLEKESGLKVDYDATGLLELAMRPSDVVRLQRVYESFRAEAIPVRWLDAAQTHELEPNLSPDVKGALHLTDEPFVDAEQLFAASRQAAQRLGCEFVVNEPVSEIVHQNGTARGVKTLERSVQADFVVVAAGIGSSGIRGIPRLPMTRIRGEAILLKGTPRFIERHLYWGDGFVTPRRDGRLLLGATYDEQAQGDDENPDTISMRNALLLMKANARIAPGILDFQITRVWKGWRPCSLDKQPILGSLGPQNVFVATGFFGLGTTMAPMAATVIRDLVLGKKADGDKELSPARFNVTSSNARLGRKVAHPRQGKQDERTFPNNGGGPANQPVAPGQEEVKPKVSERLADAIDQLRNLNPERPTAVCDVSVETAHIEFDTMEALGFPEVYERARVAITEAHRTTQPFAAASVSYSTVVLLDDKHLMRNYQQENVDAIGEYLKSKGIDYICRESELQRCLPALYPLLPEKVVKRLQRRIRNHGQPGCTEDIFIWYSLRLGIASLPEGLVEPVSDGAQSGAKPFVANRLISVLDKSLKVPEQQADDMLREAYGSSVASLCERIFV